MVARDGVERFCVPCFQQLADSTKDRKDTEDRKDSFCVRFVCGFRLRIVFNCFCRIHVQPSRVGVCATSAESRANSTLPCTRRKRCLTHVKGGRIPYLIRKRWRSSREQVVFAGPSVATRGCRRTPRSTICPECKSPYWNEEEAPAPGRKAVRP